MRDILLKFTKTTRIFFQNGGARARRAGPGSAFDLGLLRPGIKPRTPTCMVNALQLSHRNGT